MLGQYQQRGESMLSSLYRLYELLQTLENEDPYIDLVRLKKQLGREVSRHKHTTDSFNSVKQDNLNSGTIELF